MVREGRRLVPIELGRIAYGYAEEIFPLGLELASVLRGARTRPMWHASVPPKD